MAATNYTPIQLYRTTTAAATPSAGNLAAGELAINLTDEKLYFKNAAGVVKLLASSGGAVGTVSSVDVSGGTTGLTTSGGPITTSGTITLAGTLAAANGGTGQSSYTVGDLLYASGATTLSKLADVATGNALLSGGVGVAPAWGKIGLTTHVSGTLPVANGGTGATTFTSNGVLYGNGTSAVSVTAAGTTGQVLVANTGGAPSWATLTGIGVTSFSAGTTGLTPSTGTTGAITLAGTLGVANGGTGATSLTSGYLVKGNGTSAASASVVYDNGTNVGIGTTAPEVTLHLSAAQPRIQLTDTDTGADSRIDANSSAGALFISADFNNEVAGSLLGFNVDGTERMRIDSSGFVGIGTTNPSNRLSVSGHNEFSLGFAARTTSTQTGILSQPVIVLQNDSSAAGNGLGLRYQIADTGSVLRTTGGVGMVATAKDASSVTADMYFYTGTSERMRIDSAGNVGIGTSAPGSLLHLGTATPEIRFDDTDVLGVVQMRQSGAAFLITVDPTGVDAGSNLQVAVDGTERMRIDASGNVGVNTAAPTERLDVNGNARVRGNLGIFGAPPSDFWSSAALNNSLFTGYGNIGSQGSFGFDLTANGYRNSSGTWTTLNTNGSTAAAQIRLSTADGSIIFGSDATKVTGSSFSVTERMRIDSAGNVGIGTSSPGAKLNVVDSSSNDAVRITQTGTGNALVVEDIANPDATPFVVDADGRFIHGYTSALTLRGITWANLFTGIDASTSGLALARYSANASPSVLEFSKSRGASVAANTIVQSGDSIGTVIFSGADGTDYVQGASITAAVDGTPGTNDMPGRLVFSTTADGASTPTERVRIDSSGNVGIGTSSPATKLDVAGNLRFSAANPVIELNNGGPQVYTTAANTLQFATGGGIGTPTERMRIDPSGNVGIGTSSPGAKLDVSGSGSVYARARSSDTTGGAIGYVGAEFAGGSALQMRAGAGYTYLVSTGASDPLLFGTNTTERMRIDSSGNVGIGNSNPTTKLWVGSSGGGLGTATPDAISLGNTFANTAGDPAKTKLRLFQDSGPVYYGFGVSADLMETHVPSTAAMAWYTGGSERFRITSTGAITSSNLADAVGYKGIPQNAQTASYTLALSDMGKHISITTGGVVIPANGSVAFPVGSTIVIYNNSGSTQTISITTDTLRQAGTTNTGTRTLAVYGVATCIKVASTTWVVSGNVS